MVKIFGWLLLFLGLIIILYSLYSSFKIFTAVNPAPQIFMANNFGESVSSSGNDINDLLRDRLKEILPFDFLPKLFNLISWSILAGLLILGGVQISKLGINLIKK